MLHWLTTALAPGSPGTAEPVGWRLHAVEAPADATLGSIAEQRALCGLVPRHGWDLDLFIDDRCARCEKKAGLPLSPANVFRAELRRERRAK